MALTQWNPATKISRGNIAVGIATAIADIEKPKATELATGVGLDCAITTFNGTSSTDSESIDWLCTTESEQLPSSTTHEIDDLMIKTTGQEDTSLITALSIGDTIYIWRRDGVDHAVAPAAGQMVWVWKALVSSIDPLEANNTYIGITAHITVLGRSKTAVAVVA